MTLSGPALRLTVFVRGDDQWHHRPVYSEIVHRAHQAGLAGAASQKYMMALADQQEIMAAIADMVIEGYAMDSVVLRTLKLIDREGESRTQHAIAMCQVSLTSSINKVEAAAKKVVAAVAEGDMLRTQLVILRRLFKYEPYNTIALTQQIANRLIETGKYVIS